MSDNRLTEIAFAAFVPADGCCGPGQDGYGWLVHTGKYPELEGAPAWLGRYGEYLHAIDEDGKQSIALKLVYEDGSDSHGPRVHMNYMNISPDDAVRLAGHLLRCAAACKRARGS